MRARNMHPYLPSTANARPWLVAAILFALLAGCRMRGDYRRWADCEVQEAIRDKQCDPRWALPTRTVEPDPRSRMADLSCPDCGPIPPDDPAAHCFMEFPDRLEGWPYWHEFGDLPSIEFPDWQDYLITNDEGVVALNRESTLELAWLHSRDYQDQIEQLYFTALAFTLERFEFSTQWFFRSGQFFDVLGTGANASRRLSSTRNAGFTQNLTIGGQLLVDFANSFVWEFAGNNVSSASSGLLVSLTQPLLRGAFREVRLEGLTQAERSLLYNVRDFARFRRVFYVNVVGNSYLPLLATAQAIKNQEKNLESLDLNLREHEQLSRAGLVAPIQVDQVFQQYQQGRLNLLAARQSLQAALDQFKLLVGLPPQLEVALDDGVLQPFELNDPEIEAMQDWINQLKLQLVQLDEAPPVEVTRRRFAELKPQLESIEELRAKVQKELSRWKAKLIRAAGTPTRQADSTVKGESSEADEPLDDATAEEVDRRQRLEREKQLAVRLGAALEELEKKIAEDLQRVEAGADGIWVPPKEDDPIGQGDSKNGNELTQWLRIDGLLTQDDQQNESQTDGDSTLKDETDRLKRIGALSSPEELWDGLNQVVGDRIRKQLSDLFVIETQIRVYLIESSPVEIDSEWAIRTALCRRLDLMNARGNVVDAYRRVEVAADTLEAELNLRLEADLGTDPGRANPIRFDASANRYRVGVDFDSPITRLAERNVYRAAQIDYQRARRAYMALKDTIVADVRQRIRSVEFNRFSFEISKLQLLTAARQVDEAQLNLRDSTEPNSSATRNLLEALQGLLGSKNNLIQSWVSLEASRMALFRDLELMQIAPDGTWINESFKQSDGIDCFADIIRGCPSVADFGLDGADFDNIDRFESEYIETGDDAAAQLGDGEPGDGEPGDGEPGDGEPGDEEWGPVLDRPGIEAGS